MSDHDGRPRARDTRGVAPSELARSLFLSPWARALRPISLLYGAVACRRRRRADKRAIRLGAPVVSVGNITVGGTGKTPVVELVVRELMTLGRRPAILSRGYGRGVDFEGRQVNDEYLVLARRLPGVPHVQDPDRVRAGREAIAAGADALVLDDGFQHRRLHRDLDLVLVDATNPFGFGHVLPEGLLREPLGALEEADILAITRGRHVSVRKRALLATYLRRRFTGSPPLEIEFCPTGWRSLDGATVEPITTAIGKRTLGFAAIGNPEGFRRELQALGVDLVKWISFLDHHRYTLDDLDRIRRAARAVSAEFVAMTLKDAVKIPEFFADDKLAWRSLDIDPVLSDGGELLRSRLREICDGAAVGSD